MPVHLLFDAQRFDEGMLSRNRRSDLRRSRRLVDFRRLDTPALLLEQGYDVFSSAVRRLGYRRPLSGPQYRRSVERRARHGRRMFIAGLVDGRLRGYLDSYAVGVDPSRRRGPTRARFRTSDQVSVTALL